MFQIHKINKWEFAVASVSKKWLFIHCFQIELEFRSIDFCAGRKTGEPGEKPSEQGRAPTTNSTHIWRRGGERPHHCAIPATLDLLVGPFELGPKVHIRVSDNLYITVLLKHGAILYNEAEVFRLSLGSLSWDVFEPRTLTGSLCSRLWHVFMPDQWVKKLSF